MESEIVAGRDLVPPDMARYGGSGHDTTTQGKDSFGGYRMMIDSELLPFPEWKMLIKAFSTSDYGTLITHEDIERILGCKRSEKRYYNLVKRWKREMLREASRQIECVTNKGYEIVKPEAFRLSAKRQMTLAHKRARAAGEIIIKAPVELMSEEEKVKLGSMGTLVSQLLHFSKATLKKVKEIEKPVDRLVLDVGKALDIAD